jgi:hypothetical protein
MKEGMVLVFGLMQEQSQKAKGLYGRFGPQEERGNGNYKVEQPCDSLDFNQTTF